MIFMRCKISIFNAGEQKMKKIILLTIVVLSALSLMQCRFAEQLLEELNKLPSTEDNENNNKVSSSSTRAERSSSSETKKSSSSETKKARKETVSSSSESQKSSSSETKKARKETN